MSSFAIDRSSRRTWVTFFVFLVIVIGGGALVGVSSMPDPWYEALRKPPFNPPNWVFGPVWSILYVLIAVAGARTYLRNPMTPAFAAWVAQMLLNWVWSPTWFVLHAMWPAFIVVTLMWISIAAFIVLSWTRDRPSALMFIPYLCWVSFAGLLNFSVAVMN
jgi:tryptophan-rich sensory protein